MKRMMMMAAAVVLISSTWCSSKALAQQASAPPDGVLTRAGYFSLGMAGGFMVDPDMTAGMVSLDYYITDEVSVGPYFYVGGSEDDSYWGMAGQIKFSAPLMSVPQVRPFAYAGIGFINLDFQDRRDDPKMTYFFPVGWGMEWEINDMVSLEACGEYMLTEDIFVGLTVGARIFL